MTIAEPVWFDPALNFAALIVGAALSFSVTWQFERRRERREQKATAFSLIFAMQRICNDLIQLNNILRSISRERYDDLANGVELWQLMPISFGWDDDVIIGPSEMALLAGTRQTDLVVEVQEANAAHRIYTRAANRVSELKLEMANAGFAVAADGPVVQMETTTEQFAQLTPMINQLEALTEKLGNDLPVATHQALKCASKIPKVLKSHYKFDHLIGLTFDELDEDDEG